MCVHWECAWCQCQILVLTPPYPTLHKLAHRTLESSCVSTGNVRGATAKYWSQHHHIQQYTNIPTALQKVHACPLGMCVVLVPNIGLSTTLSNTTQIGPQNFTTFMCVHWEYPWCQCQILVLPPPYSTIHKYSYSTSESSCVSIGNVRGASAKYWSQHHPIQHYTNWPTELYNVHVCPLGISVVLGPNIGLTTTIFNNTQILPQHFRNFMCVQWECAWCYCQTLDLAPPYATLHKSTYSTLENSYDSTGNVRGANTKYWSQHHRIPHYTNTPTRLQQIHVCQLGMCVVLLPNINLSTTKPNTTEMLPQHFRKFMCVHWECSWCQCQILVLAPPYSTILKYSESTSETSCVPTGNVRGASAKYWSYSTTISNITQIRPQHFRKLMCVHWECPWCQCQILVLAPPYSTIHKYSHSTSETSCVSTGNVRGASYCQTLDLSPSYPTLHKYTYSTLESSCVSTEKTYVWCQCIKFVLAPTYPTLHKYTHSSSETSCVPTGNVRGASTKYWSQHHHIPHYTNTPAILQ